jgi:hypothetical protein
MFARPAHSWLHGVVVVAALATGLAAAQRRPIPLVEATQVGRFLFEPGDTPSGGNGQRVDGIEGLSTEMLAVHIHAHLSLFYNGDQIAIPPAVGIVRPLRIVNGFASGRALYWLHTHDATGIIHVESPDARAYTLGQFFDIWGRGLSRTEAAGLRGPVRAYVDGRTYRGNPRDIGLTAHAQITLEVGEPIISPPVYLFPAGL